MKNTVVIKQHIIYKALFLSVLLLCTIGYMHEMLSPYLKFFFIYGVGILIYDFIKGRRIWRDKSLWIFVGFLAIYWICCAVNADEYFVRNIKGLAYMGLFALTLYANEGDEEDVIAEGQILARFTLVILFAMSLTCLVTYLTADSFVYEVSDGVLGFVGELDGRMCGLVYFNTGGAIYAIMILLAAGILVCGKCGSLMKVFAIVSILLGAVCSALAYSRTSIAAAAVTIIIGVIVLLPQYCTKLGDGYKKFERILFAICCGVAVSGALTFFVIGQPAFDLINGIFTGRLSIWKEGLRVFAAHPLLGVGNEGIVGMLHVPSLLSWESGGLHSLYINVLVASGILGAAALTAFSVYNYIACRKLFKNPDRESIVAALLVLEILVMEIAETRVLFRAEFFGAVLFLALGYIKARARCLEEKNDI
ncbi:MAG: O-antigen ligase family protein [Lachnospiraceae bacterium]|nr:O-antigen ligase family protein [Candidatus Minthocola equi]